MQRRTLLASLAATAAVPRIGRAQNATPGVTASEIKIGHTIPYSGPASAYGVIGKGHAAFFKMVNDQGGVGGRRINFVSLDDGYVPAKTVEQTRRLVEQDEVAFLFNPLGTLTNSAIQRYVNQKKVPHLFLSTGADKWANPKDFPYTIGWQPSYRTEAIIYARHIIANRPAARVALIYQNDDFGKDYLNGAREGFGPLFDKMVVKVLSYEPTDATIDSQAVSLKDSGADVLITAAIPKFAAQMIRKVFDMGWRPVHYMSNVSSSVGAVLNPAGPEKAVGMITSAYLKDPTDPTWKDDAGMNTWRAFMAKYIPDGDLTDGGYTFSYGVCSTLLQVLKQCGTDFSRENIMKQVTSIKDQVPPVTLPGISVNITPTNYHPIQQMQLSRWTGSTWQLFGDVIQGTGA
jgi:branched-chain amino acid transport system substrate-binding protein